MASNKKNVIIQRDRFGYGLTVSGDNPVYVLSVREGGAAHRAGINTNDQIIKVNGTRVTHCTHTDVVNLIKSGSYAQLTLLGQPKLNSTSTQKIIPAENQNGRVQMRTTVHSSIPERSNSTLSTYSLQVPVDTKKDRDSYERIVKQLEKSRTDLERQRAKGVNQNQTKIQTIENQIRQYEQKLNEIKRRLTLTDPPADFGSVKSREEISIVRSSTISESTSNRTSTWYINDQYADSFNTVIPTDDGSSILDNNDPDDEVVQIQPKTALSSFNDIQQLVQASHWPALTVFLHFLLTDPKNEPNCLFFYIFAEELRLRKVDNRSEFCRWIFEIHSTFTMNGSPLYIGLPQSQTDSINGYLTQQPEITDEIRMIFNDARDFARSVIVDQQLPDFNHKRTLGAYRDIDFSSMPKQNHFIEEMLRSKFESYYKSNIDDWNSTKNAKDLALLCSLATYLKRCDIKKFGNIPLEKIPKFFDREQRRLLVRLQRNAPAKRIKDHQLIEHQFSSQIFCQVCSKALWGIQCQGYSCGYCRLAFHRECATNSERCSKDRKTMTLTNSSGSKSRKTDKNPSSPQRSTNLQDEREGSVQNDTLENMSSAGDSNDPNSHSNLSPNDQNKNANLGRCASDRRAAPSRIPAKNRSSSNPQMGGNSIDEFLGQSISENVISQSDLTNQRTSSNDLTTSPESINQSTATDDDSDLDADVNSLPNLSDFIPADILQVLYQTREWKLQTTITELIHTERTHLKSLKIMKKCFREPMERSPCMSPVELDCIFRNLDQLIDLHTLFKYALRQHREEAKDHVVRQIGDLILKFLDGETGEQFACACAYFIEDQSQALKLIKKKEQSPDFAALMRACESNPLCRRLTLKDYLPSVMTRFTKLKMLFEAMKKFVADDETENKKLSLCAERADFILKRMNYARLKKEQEALLKQIKNNLDIQIPSDDKSMDLRHLEECLEVSNNRLIYSGTLKLLPDNSAQKTEFECCLFTDTFVFFQKIPIQPSEQRGIEEGYRYVLKEHQRDASNGRHMRTRPPVNGGRHTAQNFILTPIIRLEHLLIKKKACGGARSFYVIDTDKKQLIEVEANSKDELEKWLEWIEKSRKSFEKSKSFISSANQMNSTTSTSSQSKTSRSIPIEEVNRIETIQPKLNDKQKLIEDNPDVLLNALMEKDNEVKRLLNEKELLLSRLLNVPQSQIKETPGYTVSTRSNKPSSSLEALTYAASYHNQLIEKINQTQNQAAKEKQNAFIDIQSLWTPLTQLGEQLNLALKLSNQKQQENLPLNDYHTSNLGQENSALRRNYSISSSALTITPSMLSSTSQAYSDSKDSLSMSSLHSSESLSSVVIPMQISTFNESINFDPRSSITDLDETIKSPMSKLNQHSTPSLQKTQQLHMAREVIERYDEGVFDDGMTSQNEEDENNSVVIAESDDEDEIEHFDSTDSITVSLNNPVQQSNEDILSLNSIQTCLENSNNRSIDGQPINLDLYEGELYDNVKSNDSSRTNNSASRYSSEA